MHPPGNIPLIGITRSEKLRRKRFAMLIGRVSLARENEAGAVGGRRSIFSMLKYRTSFCFWL